MTNLTRFFILTSGAALLGVYRDQTRLIGLFSGYLRLSLALEDLVLFCSASCAVGLPGSGECSLLRDVLPLCCQKTFLARHRLAVLILTIVSFLECLTLPYDPHSLACLLLSLCGSANNSRTRMTVDNKQPRRFRSQHQYADS